MYVRRRNGYYGKLEWIWFGATEKSIQWIHYYFFQILTVYYKSITIDRFKLNNSINIAGNYLYADDKGISRYHTICDKYINKLFITAAVILILLLSSYGITALSELYAIVFIDHRYTLLGMELPFVDSSVPFGYAILMTYQLFISVVSLIANISIEVGVVLIYNAFELMPALIRLRSDELSSELNVNGKTFNAFMKFRNICLQIHDFNA